jgi:hypothetical protein
MATGVLLPTTQRTLAHQNAKPMLVQLASVRVQVSTIRHAQKHSTCPTTDTAPKGALWFRLSATIYATRKQGMQTLERAPRIRLQEIRFCFSMCGSVAAPCFRFGPCAMGKPAL